MLTLSKFAREEKITRRKHRQLAWITITGLTLRWLSVGHLFSVVSCRLHDVVAQLILTIIVLISFPFRVISLSFSPFCFKAILTVSKSSKHTKGQKNAYLIQEYKTIGEFSRQISFSTHKLTNSLFLNDEKKKKKKKKSQLVSWCFKPSQPQRITSGLNTNVTITPS